MTNRLRYARISNKATAVAQIERIMMREENRNIWGRLGCATKKKRFPPASQCAVTDKNGQQQVITGQEPFQRAVANAVNHRFRGATDAPINSGQLLQDLVNLLILSVQKHFSVMIITFQRNVNKPLNIFSMNLSHCLQDNSAQ